MRAHGEASLAIRMELSGLREMFAATLDKVRGIRGGIWSNEGHFSRA